MTQKGKGGRREDVTGKRREGKHQIRKLFIHVFPLLPPPEPATTALITSSFLFSLNQRVNVQHCGIITVIMC